MAIIQTDQTAGTPSTESGDIAQSGAATPQTSGGPSASGSNFTNLQQYLDANQGAGDRLANSVVGTTQGMAQSAKDTGNKAYESIRTQNSGKWDDNLVNKAKADVSSLAPDEKTSLVSNLNYQSPNKKITDSSDWSNAQAQAAKTSQRAGVDASTAGGLGMLTGSEGAGNQNFDYTLFSGDRNRGADVNAANKSIASNLGTDLSGIAGRDVSDTSAGSRAAGLSSLNTYLQSMKPKEQAIMQQVSQGAKGMPEVYNALNADKDYTNAVSLYNYLNQAQAKGISNPNYFLGNKS